MSVIGKLLTRHFRLPLRFLISKKTEREYSIFSRNQSRVGLYPFTSRLTRVPSIVHRKLCTVNKLEKVMGALSPLDPSSFSRPELALIKHIDLSYEVDFEKRVLYGTAIYNIEVLDYIEDVILDSSDLTIKTVELDDGTPLKYKIDDSVQNLGSKLTIQLPQSAAPEQKSNPIDENQFTKVHCERAMKHDPTQKVRMTFTGFSYKPRVLSTLSDDIEDSDCEGVDLEHTSSHCMECSMVLDNIPSEFFMKHNMLKIKIKYASAPAAPALQWLEANQTSGKKHPYMFSQCQPTYARSILPCQDTPAVKFTYEAEVTAPEQFTVLMGAIRGESAGNKTSFSQPVPIPSYLLAIAVGVLESRQLGPRSHVWSEKEEIERSAWEFAETEKYLQAAEKLCGPYQWKQYDLLVLPPSFPYGGMENPCLTFVTPTLLAGDRSLADVIVHEIMHSWTGNLVTNKNFEHFWLNEGFTVFLERKVGASLVQDPEEAKRSRDFHSLLGLQELTETVQVLGENNAFTRLVVPLDGVHPDDAFSRIPYEKGSLFLRYLEDLVGGPGVFDDFMRSYLDKFQRQSIDTDQFKAYLLDYFKDNDKLPAVDWDTWLYKNGMPSIIPNYDTTMTKSVQKLLAKINQTDPDLKYNDVSSFSPHQLINLLQTLIDQDPMPLDKLKKIGDIYKINNSKNCEIVYRWLRLCVRSKDESKLNEVFTFVNSQGRMKYVRPVYRDLYAWEDVRERAIDNFLKNEPFMMHVTTYTLRKDLHLSD